jgi:hypothetical protein
MTDMGEFFSRLLGALVLGLLFALPGSLVVLLWGVACGRPWSEAASSALQVAVEIVGRVLGEA